MKNIFVVNPAAGQRAGGESFIKKIEKAASEEDIDYEIYVTKGIGDATRFVRERCVMARGDIPGSEPENLRFFACGGDGTLNEAANGLFGFENVSLGVIPIGTGNDFIRNFGTAEQFMDIKAQLHGTERTIDLIRYTKLHKDEETEGCIVNMINVGFDANVVDITATLKRKPLISGSLAYMLGVVIMLIKKKGANIRIESGGKTLKEGKVLLTAITNGCYCGGGWKGIPKAVTNDGLLDISIVKDIGRLSFVTLVPRYQKGTHLETKKGRNIVGYHQGTEATITTLEEGIRLCIDGEMTDFDKITLNIAPQAMRFIIPDKLR